MKKPKGLGSSLLIWVALFAAVFAISQFTYSPEKLKKTDDIPYSEFVEKVKSGEVYAVKMQGQEVFGTRKDTSKFKTYVPNNAHIVELLEKHKITISAEPENTSEG